MLTPTDDRTIDSIVKGGLFKSALGSASSDIILEGDEFVSPDTSYAPEEAVPGQMFDTLDIKVYTSPESGVPFITEKNYVGDGNTTTFEVGDYPGTLASVTVSVNGSVKKLTTDTSVTAIKCQMILNRLHSYNFASSVYFFVSEKRALLKFFCKNNFRQIFKFF